MDEFNRSDLEVFRYYLLELQQLPEDGSKDYKLYKRWEGSIQNIEKTALQVARFLKVDDDSALSRQVEYSITRAVRDEYFVYKQYIPYFLAGIYTVEKAVEQKLISNGLLDKKIQEMTGIEFKTLLLATLKEHQDRKGN